MLDLPHFEATEGYSYNSPLSSHASARRWRRRKAPLRLTSPIIWLDEWHRRHDRLAQFIPNVDFDFRAFFVPPRRHVRHGDVLSQCR